MVNMVGLAISERIADPNSMSDVYMSDVYGDVGSQNVGGRDKSHCPRVGVVHPGSMGCSSLAMPNQMMLMTRHSDVHDHEVKV